jgi:Protein of unknown function (DUF3455)
MKGSFAMVFKVMQIFVGFLLAGIMCGVCLEGQQVPSTIDVPPGTRLLMQAKGEGVQVYVCTEGTWTLKAPDAKLLDTQDKVIGEHFAGPTWKLNDGSQVRGKMIASQRSPDAGSVPWLLLAAVPQSGSGKFADVVYIRRTDTRGGAAPTGPCSGERRIAYSASYSFYEK